MRRFFVVPHASSSPSSCRRATRSPLALLVPALFLAAAALAACDRAKGAAPHGVAASAVCAKHGVPESRCPFCHPALVEGSAKCAEHGVSEALCYLCNPVLVAAFRAEGDWCREHERPESQCWLCHPDGDPALLRPAADLPPADVSLVTAPDADVPRSRRPPSATCTKQALRVRFARPEIAQEVGLGYARVEEQPIARTLECNATIDYERDRYARIASQTPGVVEEIRRSLGDVVAAGEVVAVVSSADAAAAKAALLAARAELDLWERHRSREADLLSRGVGTERELLEASARLAEARAAAARAGDDLRRLGLASGPIEEIVHRGDTSPRLELRSPVAGVVVERAAAAGDVTQPGATLLAVVDVSRMWALLDVFEEDVDLVRGGQPVVVRVEALPGETFGGRLSWVAAGVDPTTRVLAARALLDNREGRLKAALYGRATVTVHDARRAVVVPRDAVQWEGCCNIVFVRRDDTLFEPRKVRLGASTGTLYEVLEGVAPGEAVVTGGAFLLKTELLKGDIGAGCCEVAPGV
ncbi:MAG: efflux RND transporter periplasmic adaptor subunit [bacterium]